MNASARKELPPPDPMDLGAAMRRRYQTGQAEEETAESASADDVTTPPRHDVTADRRRDVTADRRRDVTTPRRRSVTTSRRRGAPPARSDAPAAADSVPLTVRFDPDKYEVLEDWLTELRRELGWRKLDKSLVVRTLLELAQARPEVRRALVHALTK